MVGMGGIRPGRASCQFQDYFGLRAAEDVQIWDHARVQGLMIVSKDTDFRERSYVERFPPNHLALALAWPDFEDAVCAAAAEASGCDALVTRDPDGYPNAPLPVIDPAAALSWLTQE